MPPSFDPVRAPALGEQQGQTFPRLVELMQRLLGDDGCPWDRQQTFASLRRYVLEEACEVLDAIDRDDKKALREELGDLLLQVVFQAELARKERLFGPDDVVQGICEKLLRRHPHVFGDVQVQDSEDVLKNWERIKAAEKQEPGLLSGLPISLPALVRAQRVGEKVQRVGFDWPDAAGSRDKVEEELAELDHAISTSDSDAIEAELGDVLFALVNLARHVGVDAESALRRTTNKFVERFSHVEKRVHQQHGGFYGCEDERLPLDTLDSYWQEAKAAEKP